MKAYCLNDLLNWDLIDYGDVVIENLILDDSIDKIKVPGEPKTWFYTDDEEVYRWYGKYAYSLATINDAIEYGLISKKEFRNWRLLHYKKPDDLISFADDLEKSFIF